MNKTIYWALLLGGISILLASGCAAPKAPSPFDSAKLNSIQFTFTDQDKDKGEIQGDVKLTPKQGKMADVTHYVLRWGGTASASTGLLIKELSATEAQEVLYTFPENSALSDKYIILFLKNEKAKEGNNETNSGLRIKVKDVFEKEPEPVEEPVPVAKPEVVKPALTMIENVQFDFDKSIVKPEFKEYLKQLFDPIENKAQIKLRLSGHCDERGSNEYNIALGERRALAVKRYLTALGLNNKNLITISFGEEKPLDTAQTEEAWAKNRRVEFEIQSQ